MDAAIVGFNIKIKYPVQSYPLPGNLNPDGDRVRDDTIISGSQYIQGVFCA